MLQWDQLKLSNVFNCTLAPYEENIIYLILFLGPDDDINFVKYSPRPRTDIKILAL